MILGSDRDRKRGDRRDNKRDDEGLKRLAKLASRVLDNGEPLTIEKESMATNVGLSYDNQRIQWRKF